MITIVIIEEKKPLCEELISLLHQTGYEIEIKACFYDLEEAYTFLNSAPEIDLIFSDVYLGGVSTFELFKNTSFCIPVVFITAYKDKMIDALSHNGIDFIIKPFTGQDINKVLTKYDRLKKHFSMDTGTIDNLLQLIAVNKKERIIVKNGQESFNLLLDDIVLFYSEKKVSYAIDASGKRYMATGNLAEIQAELNKNFFRVNRKFIMNIKYIKSFKPYERVRIQVLLTLPVSQIDDIFLVSQETAPQFKNWIWGK